MQSADNRDPQLAAAPDSARKQPSAGADPLASPTAAPSVGRLPTSTSKLEHSFSIGRAKRGQLTALETSDLPPKRVRTPEGAGPSGSSPAAAGA